MRIAVGIPTLNRPDDVRRTVNSILENTEVPDAIYVADQSDDDRTKNVCEELSKNSKGVEVVYLRMDRKGLTHARNRILDEVAEKYDVVTFLDDDVVLDKSYIFEVKNTFKQNPQITGVTGRILNVNLRILKSSFRAILRGAIDIFLGMFLPPRVNKYFVNTYPIILPFQKNIMRAQWLSGCNMSYRVSDITGRRFEEQFILYSYGEDLIFSYGLHQEGKKLVLNPRVRLVHLESPAARITGKAKLLMMLGYKLYAMAKFRPKEKVNELFKKYVRHTSSSSNKRDIEELMKVIAECKEDILRGDLKILNERIIALLHVQT
jgi:GT2 family glycosyltransferase